MFQDRKRFPAGVAIYRSESNFVLPSEGEEAFVLFTTSTSLRALCIPKRKGVPVAEQNDNTRSGLRVKWNLQLYHSFASPLQVQDIAKSHHFTLGASPGHCVLRRHFVLSISLLDARIY